MCALSLCLPPHIILKVKKKCKWLKEGSLKPSKPKLRILCFNKFCRCSVWRAEFRRNVLETAVSVAEYHGKVFFGGLGSQSFKLKPRIHSYNLWFLFCFYHYGENHTDAAEWAIFKWGSVVWNAATLLRNRSADLPLAELKPCVCRAPPPQASPPCPSPWEPQLSLFQTAYR